MTLMKNRILYILLSLTAFFPQNLSAQTGDKASTEAFIADHKKYGAILTSRAILETANRNIFAESNEQLTRFKNLSDSLDKYRKFFDWVDLGVNTLQTATHMRKTYENVKRNLNLYVNLLNEYKTNVLDNTALTIHTKMHPRDIVIAQTATETISDLSGLVADLGRDVAQIMIYVMPGTYCTARDLMIIIENINVTLDRIDYRVYAAYYDTFKYIRFRMGYWLSWEYYKRRPQIEINEEALERWRERYRRVNAQVSN